jgi:hypothetical protein
LGFAAKGNELMSDFKHINRLAGAAIALGFADEIIELNQVLAFDLRFNLRHPKIAAIYMLETPINGCHFEVVKRDGGRYHTGGDIAGKILGEEKAYMSNLEQIALQAKEQSGLIKQFCRKCDLFGKLYPQEAQEQAQKDRAKAMEEQYLDQAGSGFAGGGGSTLSYLDRANSVMARLANADKSLPEEVPQPIVAPVVSAAVSTRLRTKLRINCEVQYAVAQAHLPKWIDFLHGKIGQVLGGGEHWADSDPTGTLRFEAKGGKIILRRDGEVVGEWRDYEEAHKYMVLGTNSLPNPVLPLTKTSYDRTVAGIPADEATLKKAIRAQVTSSICNVELWSHLGD